jgi:NodT family efflux transporter outer membrane factor (OMF) lipoprotein
MKPETAPIPNAAPGADPCAAPVTRPGLICARSVSAVSLALAACAALALTGCASSSGIASRASLVAPEVLGLKAQARDEPAIAADWWQACGDGQFTALIERALDGSPGLRVAQSRVERAVALAGGLQASEGLQVSGSADLTREHFSGNSIYPPPLGRSIRTLVNAQFGAGWEFDFFGRNRAAIAAAVGSGRAAAAEAQAARNVLSSQVARSYGQLVRLFEQRAIAERALQQRAAVLGLVQQRVLAGLDTTVELRQGEAALPEARVAIEQLDEQITLTRNALAALSAQPPQALQSLHPPAAAPALPALPAQLPADLLARRADIAAARWRIEAASQDVASARAAFYPNINLGAFVGLSSIGFDKFLQAGSEQYGVGPAIRLPIFDSGRLRANLKGKAADLDAAIESYNAAVLDAVHEAADPIASLRAIERQQREQAQALGATESAHDLAQQRYHAGLSTFLTVLNAEAAVLNQRRLAADLRARVWESQVILIRALGGGYSAEPPPPPSPSPSPSPSPAIAAAAAPTVR